MARQPYLTVNGKRVPSVTTVLSRFKDSGALMYWANQVGLGEKECDDQEPCRMCGRRAGKYTRDAKGAAEVGTFAHALIDKRIKGTKYDDAEFIHLTDEQHEAAYDCLETFDRWWTTSGVDPLETEIRLVSEEHRFGGTIDLIGRVDGRFSVIDWKTSKGVYADYVCQLAAYMLLTEENGFPDVEEIHILRISKETAGFEHRMIPRRMIEPAVDYFLKARALYDVDKDVQKLLK